MAYAQILQEFYCGIDLHGLTMFVCIMDKLGKIHFHEDMPNDFPRLLLALKSYLGRVAVGVESTYNWYWLGDACHQHKIPFYLGHALYMKAIHGGKKKDDKIDSRTIANLMRSQYFPMAYAYPEKMRATRDLLRRRTYYVRIRAAAYTHVRNTFAQQGILDVERKDVLRKSSRDHLPERLNSDPCLSAIITQDFAVMREFDDIIDNIEKLAMAQAKDHDRAAYELLQTIPGVGPILAMVLLYEIHDIRRFATPQKFSSYCRLVKVAHTSAGKRVGGGNNKIGNPYLKWAFSEAFHHAAKYSAPIRKYYDKLKGKCGAGRAASIIAHRFGVAVYYMLKNGNGFDEKIFLSQNYRGDGEPGAQLEKQVRTESLSISA